MSYTINISGHKDFETVEEAMAFEKKQLAAAKRLAAGLEGVNIAGFSGGHTGYVDILKKEAT